MQAQKIKCGLAVLLVLTVDGLHKVGKPFIDPGTIRRKSSVCEFVDHSYLQKLGIGVPEWRQ